MTRARGLARDRRLRHRGGRAGRELDPRRSSTTGPRKASRMAIFNLGLFVRRRRRLRRRPRGRLPARRARARACRASRSRSACSTLPVPAHPAQHDRCRVVALPHAARQAVRRRGARSCCASATLRWLIVSTTAMAFAAGGFNAWLLDFLERDKGHDRRARRRPLLSIAMVGAVAGIIVGGRLADRLRARLHRGPAVDDRRSA